MKKLLFSLLVVNLFWSFSLYSNPSHVTYLNFFYNLSYGLNFLIAAIICFYYTKKYHAHKYIYNTMGIGASLFFLAQVIWVYYNTVLLLQVPYPGVSDLFWVLFYLFTAIAGLMIMIEIKISFTWDKLVEIFIISSAIFFIIYTFISENSSQENLPILTSILNISYPIFDSLLLSLSLTAIRSQMGNLKPLLLFFVFAFMAFAFGDTLFSYQTTLNIYWNGNLVDAIFAIAGYLFAMGIIDLPQLLRHEDKVQPTSTV